MEFGSNDGRVDGVPYYGRFGLRRAAPALKLVMFSPAAVCRSGEICDLSWDSEQTDPLNRTGCVLDSYESVQSKSLFMSQGPADACSASGTPIRQRRMRVGRRSRGMVKGEWQRLRGLIAIFQH